MPAPRGYAMQLRVNMEVMDENGATQADRRHADGVRSAVRPGRAGRYASAMPDTRPAPRSTRCSPRSSFIRRPRAGPTWCRRRRARCANSASRASPPTLPFMQAVLAHPDFVANRISTEFHRSATLQRWSAQRRTGRAAAVLRRRRRRRRGAHAFGRARRSWSGRIGAGAGAAAGHGRRDRGEPKAIWFVPASRSP